MNLHKLLSIIMTEVYFKTSLKPFSLEDLFVIDICSKTAFVVFYIFVYFSNVSSSSRKFDFFSWRNLVYLQLFQTINELSCTTFSNIIPAFTQWLYIIFHVVVLVLFLLLDVYFFFL